MINKNIFLLGLIVTALLYSNKAKAQDTLTLQEAIQITLENNYNIKLVANDLEINKNNVTVGNAGMLPSVNATLSNNNSIQDSRQVRENGTINERNGARNSSFNAGVGLNWTVFDGFGMFVRYDQLQELQRLGEANLKAAILGNVSDIITIYYGLVQQQQELEAIKNSLEISKFRVETAQNRFTIGKAAKLEVLNAQVDLNADTTRLLRQQENYRRTQISLNELMARDINLEFQVSDTVLIDDKLNLTQLTDQSAAQNPALQAVIINKRVAQLELRRLRADRYPTVSVNTGYNINESRSALGFATQTSGKGFNYGVTASFNIFNGFQQRRVENNASIQIKSAQLEYERLNKNISAQLASAYQTYNTNLALVKLEERNLAIAQQNLDITLEKYRLGSITPLEFRDAQLNMVDATVRFSNAQYEAKLAEIALKEISGTINLPN